MKTKELCTVSLNKDRDSVRSCVILFGLFVFMFLQFLVFFQVVEQIYYVA